MSTVVGQLLTEALKTIAAREHKTMTQLQEEIGLEVGYSAAAVQAWRQGRSIPPDRALVKLARISVTRAKMDQGWLARLLKLAGFTGAKEVVSELFPDIDQTPVVVPHNLPRRSDGQFVGRQHEIARLEYYLSANHRVGVVCIHGTAGVGKTALALEFAERLINPTQYVAPFEQFKAIIWLTAKHWALLPSQVAAREPTLTSLHSVYRAISHVLDLRAVENVEEQAVGVATALARDRMLLILDNLEDIDDPSLLVFLEELPEPSKAIVTTRHRIGGAAIMLHLSPFQEEEATELIVKECERREVYLSEEQRGRLLRSAGGLPLAIVRTIARMAWRGSSIDTELKRLSDEDADIQTFCFENSIALIRGANAHAMFMVLTFFEGSASRKALGYAAGLIEDVQARDEALSDLEVLSLVDKTEYGFTLEPLTKIRAGAELSVNPEFHQDARERWLGWYRDFTAKCKAQGDFSALRAELDNLLSVMEWLADQGRLSDVRWFLGEMHEFLVAEGHWKESFERLFKLRQPRNDSLERVFGGEYLLELLQVMEATVQEQTVTLNSVDLFRHFYRRMLKVYPKSRFLATSLPSAQYFWTDATFDKAMEEFVKRGGQIERIFFINGDGNKLEPEMQAILDTQHNCGVELYLTNIQGVPEDLKRLFVVESKGEIAWEAKIDEEQQIVMITATADEYRIEEYLDIYKRLRNRQETMAYRSSSA